MMKALGIILLLIAIALLAGAFIAAVWLSPVLCRHYHWSCPGS